MITFKEYILESIKVSNNNASKYFKLIQKGTKSRTWDVENVKGGYIVTFRGGIEDFNLLVNTSKGRDGWIVGYSIGDDTSKFRMIPGNFNSVKDIIKDYKILKRSSGKELSIKEIFKNADTQISLKDDDNAGTYKVKDKKELIEIIKNADVNADLNYLDVSGITDMSELFKRSKFNGDISKWDVSNVTNMSAMFAYADFNGDISKWDVSNVTDMSWMFKVSKFRGDISKWDVSNVIDMEDMFNGFEIGYYKPDWYREDLVNNLHIYGGY